MKSRDLSGNPRIASLTKLTEMLPTTITPLDTLNVVARAMTEAYGPSTFLGLSTRGLPAGHYRIVQFRVDGVAIEGFNLWDAQAAPVRCSEMQRAAIGDSLESFAATHYRPGLVFRS